MCVPTYLDFLPWCSSACAAAGDDDADELILLSIFRVSIKVEEIYISAIFL